MLLLDDAFQGIDYPLGLPNTPRCVSSFRNALLKELILSRVAGKPGPRFSLELGSHPLTR